MRRGSERIWRVLDLYLETDDGGRRSGGEEVEGEEIDVDCGGGGGGDGGMLKMRKKYEESCEFEAVGLLYLVLYLD